MGACHSEVDGPEGASVGRRPGKRAGGRVGSGAPAAADRRAKCLAAAEKRLSRKPGSGIGASKGGKGLRGKRSMDQMRRIEKAASSSNPQRQKSEFERNNADAFGAAIMHTGPKA